MSSSMPTMLPPAVVEVQLDIDVQPPEFVRVNRFILPPVIARTGHTQLVEAVVSRRSHAVGICTLTNDHGDDCTNKLRGDFIVNGRLTLVTSLINGGGSNGSSSGRGRGGNTIAAPAAGSSAPTQHQCLYFLFGRISVAVPGTYRLNLRVDELSLATGESATRVMKQTERFMVLNHTSEVRPELPGKLFGISVEMVHVQRLACMEKIINQ